MLPVVVVEVVVVVAVVVVAEVVLLVVESEVVLVATNCESRVGERKKERKVERQVQWVDIVQVLKGDELRGGKAIGSGARRARANNFLLSSCLTGCLLKLWLYVLVARPAMVPASCRRMQVAVLTLAVASTTKAAQVT